MKVIVLMKYILVLILTGCINMSIPDSFRDIKHKIERTPDSVNVGLLIASDLTLACDLGETEWVDWGDKYVKRIEVNPVLGTHPDALKIGVYFAAVIGVNTAIYPLLPKWARTLWYSGMIIDESNTDFIYNERPEHQPPVCGVGHAYSFSMPMSIGIINLGSGSHN
jgi:hypothetical protein